ncbi:hypothetical protein [Sediminibacter sp. Hel_I_10]|uniref:hypothetical protein n=1 Tax=Sediminibacter sp. Hel_I_10 TaxID=1392490 RepID=UPI0004786F2A|nr:hypothetical protein [Sediminibacter sp. Hel_I_10]
MPQTTENNSPFNEKYRPYIDGFIKVVQALMLFLIIGVFNGQKLLEQQVQMLLISKQYDDANRKEIREYLSEPRFTEKMYIDKTAPIIEASKFNSRDIRDNSKMMHDLNNRLIRLERNE